MKVSELVSALSKMDQEATVLVCWETNDRLSMVLSLDGDSYIPAYRMGYERSKPVVIYGGRLKGASVKTPEQN